MQNNNNNNNSKNKPKSIQQQQQQQNNENTVNRKMIIQPKRQCQWDTSFILKFELLFHFLSV